MLGSSFHTLGKTMSHENGVREIEDDKLTKKTELEEFVNAVATNNQQSTVTIFTTFPRHQHPHNAEVLLRNWASLAPAVKPVLFLSENQYYNEPGSLWNMAIKVGKWQVLQVPETNEHGTPYMHSMFREVFTRYNSLFFGYANCNVLFSKDIVNTLEQVWVKQGYDSGEPSKELPPPFVVGQRRSAFLKTSKKFGHHETVFKTAIEHPVDNTCNVDYFFTIKDGFPWSEIPEVVAGRPYYDVYLLLVAMYTNMTTVDATESITALRMLGGYNNTEKIPDRRYNFESIEQYGRLPLHEIEGCVTSCEFQTRKTCNQISIVKNRFTRTPGVPLQTDARQVLDKHFTNFRNHSIENVGDRFMLQMKTLKSLSG